MDKHHPGRGIYMTYNQYRFSIYVRHENLPNRYSGALTINSLYGYWKQSGRTALHISQTMYIYHSLHHSHCSHIAS